jgi:hypothetical protein
VQSCKVLTLRYWSVRRLFQPALAILLMRNDVNPTRYGSREVRSLLLRERGKCD